MTHIAIQTEVEVSFARAFTLLTDVNAEIEHLLKESNIRKPCHFVLNSQTLQILYVHLSEVFAKMKLPGILMLLSFNKRSISALTAPTVFICQ